MFTIRQSASRRCDHRRASREHLASPCAARQPEGPVRGSEHRRDDRRLHGAASHPGDDAGDRPGAVHPARRRLRRLGYRERPARVAEDPVERRADDAGLHRRRDHAAGRGRQADARRCGRQARRGPAAGVAGGHRAAADGARVRVAGLHEADFLPAGSPATRPRRSSRSSRTLRSPSRPARASPPAPPTSSSSVSSSSARAGCRTKSSSRRIRSSGSD